MGDHRSTVSGVLIGRRVLSQGVLCMGTKSEPGWIRLKAVDYSPCVGLHRRWSCFTAPRQLVSERLLPTIYPAPADLRHIYTSITSPTPAKTPLPSSKLQSPETSTTEAFKEAFFSSVQEGFGSDWDAHLSCSMCRCLISVPEAFERPSSKPHAIFWKDKGSRSHGILLP